MSHPSDTLITDFMEFSRFYADALQHDRDLSTKAAELTEYCQDEGCGRVATTECRCGAFLCDAHELDCPNK